MKQTSISPSSAKQHTEVDEHRQCLMIDINGKKLLVPRVLVVEIIDHEGLLFTAGSHPDIRHFSWRGLEVPLIAGRVISPVTAQNPAAPGKVVIFHGIARPGKLPFYAIESDKNPRLVNVAEQDITEISNLKKLSRAELMRVDVSGESAVIPRIDFLETYIQEACATDRPAAGIKA